MREVLFSGPAECLPIVEDVLGENFLVKFTNPIESELIPAFERCSAFLDASMRVAITENNINNAKKLKLISTATTGASHIDQKALNVMNIPLFTLKGQRELLNDITPAAELSWLLLMSCARHLRKALHHVEDALWDRTLFPGLMLKGKTIGIIGLGRLGTWMSRYADAFGMKILAYDPNLKEFPDNVVPTDFDDLLASSDFITLHLHLTDKTRKMFNEDKVKKMKKGSIFINTSRAEIVDNAALVSALEDNTVLAVGVDVLENEPNVESDILWQYAQTHSNVIITPHIGGFSPEAVKIVVKFAAARIRDYMEKL